MFQSGASSPGSFRESENLPVDENASSIGTANNDEENKMIPNFHCKQEEGEEDDACTIWTVSVQITNLILKIMMNAIIT